MSPFRQTVIPAAASALVAGRIAWTRTSRLQRTINTNLDLLGRLPVDHPNRAALEAHNGELLELLVRRQQRRFGPFTQAGVSFGLYAGVGIVALMFAGLAALFAAKVIPLTSASDPPDPRDQWASAVFFLLVAVGFAVAAVIAARRQLREHPAQLERDLGTNSAQPQPSEAG